MYVCCVLRRSQLSCCRCRWYITRCACCRYPRACHLICLRVGAEAAKLASTNRGVSSGEALTPSKGKGRAMHGQRMVEWLEVRRRCVTLYHHSPRSLTRFGFSVLCGICREKCFVCFVSSCAGLDPFRTAVSFWGHTTLIISALYPNRTAVLLITGLRGKCRRKRRSQRIETTPSMPGLLSLGDDTRIHLVVSRKEFIYGARV